MRDLNILIVCVNITAITPNDFEAFYTSFKSYENSLTTELATDLLKSSIMQFKHREVFLRQSYDAVHCVYVMTESTGSTDIIRTQIFLRFWSCDIDHMQVASLLCYCCIAIVCVCMCLGC